MIVDAAYLAVEGDSGHCFVLVIRNSEARCRIFEDWTDCDGYSSDVNVSVATEDVCKRWQVLL